MSTQIVSKQIGSHLVHRLVQPLGNHLQGEPSMITASNVGALRTSMTALAPFDAGELLQLATRGATARLANAPRSPLEQSAW